MIDSSEGDAEDRWRTIDAELSAYGAGLDERPQAIVLNKIDLSPEPPAFDDRRRADRARLPRLRRDGRGHRGAEARALRARAAGRGRAGRTGRRARSSSTILVYRPQPARRAYRVFRTERGFRVTGRPPAGEELEAVLRAAGAREGDEVEIGDEVLEWT